MTCGAPNIHGSERKVTFPFNRIPENERSLERPRKKYENNIKIHLKNIFVDCSHMGSVSSLTVRRLHYFEHENVILSSI